MSDALLKSFVKAAMLSLGTKCVAKPYLYQSSPEKRYPVRTAYRPTAMFDILEKI